jgi:K+-sensing histidine kinase KdpD
MKLAEELGATTAALSGESVSEALLIFARQRNVSRIVVGRPLHSRWRDRLRLDTQFLTYLSDQGLLGRLARLDLPPGTASRPRG